MTLRLMKPFRCLCRARTGCARRNRSENRPCTFAVADKSVFMPMSIHGEKKRTKVSELELFRRCARLAVVLTMVFWRELLFSSTTLKTPLLPRKVGLFNHHQTFLVPYKSPPIAALAAADTRRDAALQTKGLHQVFVNPSLIISTQLENKLPGSDAEPEIMPLFESKLRETRRSMAPTARSLTH